MREDDRVRVEHMIDAAESAAEFTFGRQPPDLNTDRMLLFAEVRAIEASSPRRRCGWSSRCRRGRRAPRR